MITENREQFEVQSNDESCIQALESFLRYEASPASINNTRVEYAFEQRLALKARDWNTRHCGKSIPIKHCVQLAKEAIKRYKDNWKNKTQGEDDRAQRLGKSKYIHR